MNQKTNILLIVATFLLAVIIFFEPLRFLDNLFYDLNFAFSPQHAGDQAVVVAFDAKSLSTVGGWPWSRSKIAEVVEKINACRPRVIALDILLPIRDAKEHNDRLAEALSKVKNCIVPFRAVEFSTQTTNASPIVTSNIYRYRFLRLLHTDDLKNISFYQVSNFDSPDTLFSRYAHYSGFLNISTSNTSQKLREIIHVVRSGDEYFPSFSLSAVAAYYNLKPEQFTLDGKGYVWLGEAKVRISSHAASALINFRSQDKPIITISALDILNGSVDRKLVADKLVFLGVDDPAAGADFFTTPVASQYPGVKVWATTALDIFENSAIVRGGGLLGLGNWLLAFIIFPGLVLFFGGVRRRLGVALGLGLLVMSVLLGYLLFKHVNYFWNPGHHLFAWLFSLLWLAAQKATVESKIIEPLMLEPPEDVSVKSPEPPEEDFVLPFIPKTTTAHHVLDSMISDVPTVVLKPGKNGVHASQTLSGDAEKISAENLAKFQNVGNAKIVGALGSGGMADVYLVWNPRMEVYRAVKVLKPNQPKDFVQRFETEIRIFAKLDHPNIVHCYTVGEWHSLPYFEMEYVNGAPLDEILHQCGPLSAEQTAIIGSLICRALDYAHNVKLTIYGKTYSGVVHRDLKPANILLGRSGRIKLTDFGIARPASVSLHTTDTGNIVGTLPYISPEQLDGQDLDAQSDIYALGVTMYEMLLAKKAFPQKEAASLIRAKSLGKTDAVLTASDHIPKRLADIIHTAMAVDRQKRYRDSHSLLHELDAFLHERLTRPGYEYLLELVNLYWR